MIQNNSRPYKFEVGTLVVYGGEVCLVDHHSGPEWCHIVKDGGFPFPVPERFLRALTFAEFASFTHPESGVWMVGNTRGYMALIIHLFALALIAAAVHTWGDGPTWTAAVLGVAIIAGFWIGTYLNYTGRWK